MIAVTLAARLLLLTAVGIFAQKSHIVGERFSADLTAFLMKIIIPVMIFHSIRSGPAFTGPALRNCLWATVCGGVTMALSLGIGQLLYLRSGRTGMGRILRYSAVFTHYSFMGIPVMDTLFGQMGTLYYVFFMIPVRILYYALSEPLMTPAECRKGGRSAGQMLRGTLLNPALVAVMLGFVFWFTGWKIPGVLDYCVSQISSLCSPLGLMLCGLILGRYEFRGLLSPRCLAAPVLRLAVMPALFLVITRGLVLAGVERLVCDMMLIYAALPVASLLPVYAKQYDPDPDNQFAAAGTCVVSTLLSSVTVPLWYMLVQTL